MSEQEQHQFVTRADADDCSLCSKGIKDPVHLRLQSTEDRVRVLRLVEYEGPRAAVELQVERSMHGTRIFDIACNTTARARQTIRITAVTLGLYPKVVEAGREQADPRQTAELRQQQRDLTEMLKAKQAEIVQARETIKTAVQLKLNAQEDLDAANEEIKRLKQRMHEVEVREGARQEGRVY